ncbi:hypothetical protein GEMRC1_009182 [Eukaryota sp. GEM-RC1]
MIIGLLLLSCCVLGSIFKWDATSSGLWSEGSNWDQTGSPSISSSVVISTQSTTITVTIDDHVIISSLTLSSSVVLFFKAHSTLTISGTLLLNGGTLHTNAISSSSTSVHSLVLDADLVSFLSHKLVVTDLFDWKRGSIDLDEFSELVLDNVTYTSFNDGESSISSDVLHVWGRNNDGQLGGGLSGNQLSPESFTLPYPIRQASAAIDHSLVLLVNGDVYTSGSNNYSPLGYVGGDRKVHAKIQISNIVQAVASARSNRALNISGYVYSWGWNRDGQLGLGHTNNIYTPTLIPNLSNVKQIAGRFLTAFALTRDGKVYGWGWGRDNVLCKTNTINEHSPMLINSLQNIKFIAAGRAAFFIKEDGSTLTCGFRLGDTGTYSTPTPFAEDIEFVFIDTVLWHAVGIDVNQKLWSWGRGDHGRLGRGSTSDSATPVEVKNIGKVITAAAGPQHSTAVDVNNDVWSWGGDSNGALGRTTSQSSPATIPGRITHLEGKGVTSISAYYRSNFAYSYCSHSSIVSGQGKLSLISSEVQLSSYNIALNTISLSYSTLYLNDVSLNNLKNLELCDNSLVNLTQDSKIESDDLTITLNSSELYCDGSNDITISKLNLIVINSHFQNTIGFTNFHLLDLSFATFESFDSEVIVGSLLCSYCQVLRNSLLSIDSYLEVNSGNFSSSLIVLESAENSLITGTVQFGNSVDLFSHVFLDDVAVSASSLTVSSNAVLLFKNNSTLTVTNTLLLNAGTFHTDLSSSSSFTSANSVVLESLRTFLISHKLIVSGYFDHQDGVLELDELSVLEFVNVTGVVLKSSGTNTDSNSNLFLHYTWHDSYNTIDHSGIHDSDAIKIEGPESGNKMELGVI